MTTNNKLSNISRMFLMLAAVSIGVAITLPIWKIDLMAPQYPEGLALQIFANKLGGDVEIINGLNHYIGMKTLHTEDFPEFTFLPYIMGFFALFSLICAIIPNRKMFATLFILFTIFGILALADFYRWNYNYGHDLDPNAAIVVPGMAYQPPVIGYKQLLNFGAYSFPDTGGLLFFGSAILFIFILFKDRFIKLNIFKISSVILLISSLGACKNSEPEPIKVNQDLCAHCKMTIADLRFAVELVTEKGRIYKFDDVICLDWYREENPDHTNGLVYVSDFLPPSELHPVSQLTFIQGKNLMSPMGGNIAAFSSNDSALFYNEKLGTTVISWNEIDF